jgi:glutamate synthase (NADPH/NADH) small chain
VTQIEILPKPPVFRTPDNPWPFYGKTLKNSTSHEEGVERIWSLSTRRFTGENGIVRGIEVEDVIWEKTNGSYTMKPVRDTIQVKEADLVLLALGFVHPVIEGLVSELGLELNERQNIRTNGSCLTSVNKVFAAGDSVSGASLVVNAIASGRKAAKEIDKFLKG